jgi:hypothetical protein
MGDVDRTDESGDLDEAGLRAAIKALEAERVSMRDAHWSWDRGIGSVLITLGKAWVLGVVLATVAVMAVAIALALSWVVVGIGLVALLIETLFIETSLEGWAQEHNATVDDRIKALLSQGAPQNDWTSLRGDAGEEARRSDSSGS